MRPVPPVLRLLGGKDVLAQKRLGGACFPLHASVYAVAVCVHACVHACVRGCVGGCWFFFALKRCRVQPKHGFEDVVGAQNEGASHGW